MNQSERRKLAKYGKVHVYRSSEDRSKPFKTYTYYQFTDMLPLYQKDGESDYEYVLRCCSSWQDFYSQNGSSSVAVFDGSGVVKEKRRRETPVTGRPLVTLGELLKSKGCIP